MRKNEKQLNICLNEQGIDAASETAQKWMNEAGVAHDDVLRIRLALEELLDDIRRHYEQPVNTELSFRKRIGSSLLQIRYEGDRFDPSAPSGDEVEDLTQFLLTEIGTQPYYRLREGTNELLFRIPSRKLTPEVLMLICIAAGIAVGLAGSLIPSGIRTGIIDFGLSFLSGGFLNLLNTFIGLMIFLSVVNGICGIGNAAALGRIGKKMMLRYIAITFVLGLVYTVAAYFSFPLHNGSGAGGSQIHAVLELVFGLLPSNPVKPFLEGNTPQIVLLAVLIGTILVLMGNKAEHVRILFGELSLLVMRCISVVCILLPVYIFSSLVIQLWTGGPDLFLRFWKPLVLCIVICALSMAVYFVITCVRLKAKPDVLLPKLIPDFLIGLSTSSSAAALASSMEINEKKLGIDSSFTRMASPIGVIIFPATSTLMFVLIAGFLAESYGMQANIAWWITMWIASSLLSMSQPPVAGGVISCLSILLMQLSIPQEGLPAAVALAMLMDFFCTAARIFILHLEMSLQANNMHLINLDIFRQKL